MTIRYSKQFHYEDPGGGMQRHPDDDQGRRVTTVYLADNNERQTEVARLHVQHTEASSVTQYPRHPAMRTVDAGFSGMDSGVMNGARGSAATGDYRMEAYDDAWATKGAARVAREGEVPGQIPLFNHRSRPARDTLDYLRTSTGGRALSVPLIGMAARDSMMHGRALLPSDDLSKHSAPLVAKVNKNLGTQFPSERTNDLEIYPMEGPAEKGTQTILPKDVELGRGFARRAFHSPRPQPAYDQGTLF